MPFGAHETMEAHEMLSEKINLINHFTMYANMCQDNYLRDMLNRHVQAAVQSYDRLLAYTHDYEAAGQLHRPFGTPGMAAPQQVQYGLRQPAPVMPNMQGQLGDRQIVSSMLACHKNSAKNHMAAAIECADGNLRQMLIEDAVACANQAYEVFLYMNQHGQYQVPTMQDHTAKTFLHTYQPAAGMQQTQPQ